MLKSILLDNINKNKIGEHGTYRKCRPSTVLLSMEKYENQSHLQKINIFQDMKIEEESDDYIIVDAILHSDDETSITSTDILTDTVDIKAILNESKTSTRTLPNILRNNSKMQLVNEFIPLQLKETSTLDVENDKEISYVSITKFNNVLREEKVIKREFNININKLPHKRKQSYDPVILRKRSPDRTIRASSIEDAEQQQKKENIVSASESMNNTPKKTKGKSVRRKKRRKYKASISSDQSEKSLIETFSEKETIQSVNRRHSDAESIHLSFLEVKDKDKDKDKDEIDLYGSIDFSSNAIFNKFNYEFYDVDYANYLGESFTNSNENHNPVRSMYYCDTQGNECDLNGNNMCETSKYSASGNNEYKENKLESVSLVTKDNYSDLRHDQDAHLSSSFISDIFDNLEFKNFTDIAKDMDTNIDTLINDVSELDTKEKAVSLYKEYDCDFETENTNKVDINESSLLQQCLDDFDSYSLQSAKEKEKESEVVNSRNSSPFNSEASLSLKDSEKLHLNFIQDDTIDDNKIDDNKINDNEIDDNGIANDLANTVTGTLRNNDTSSTDETVTGSKDEQTVAAKKRRSINAPKKTLNTRRKKYDRNKGKYTCLLCPLSFSTARSLALHKTGVHGGVYENSCEKCGRLFNKKYEMNRHLNHCGRDNLPYKCNVCDKKYRHRSTLVHHLRTMHHIEYKDDKFTCSKCSKTYSKYGAFEKHVKSHKLDW